MPKIKKDHKKHGEKILETTIPETTTIISDENAAENHILERLYNVIQSRKGADPKTSHSARLLARGTPKIAQKFGEEAVECLIEAVAKRRDLLIGESADVLYHLMVLWVDAGVTPSDVWEELRRREGVSGIAEKASRPKAEAQYKK